MDDVDVERRQLRVRPGQAAGVGDGGGTARGSLRGSTAAPTSGPVRTAEQDDGTETAGATDGASAPAPARTIALDDWWVELLGPLVEGKAPERPLLRNRSGDALTPRRLQRRIAQHVVALGDELAEPLTLERLRDRAAYQMLVGGATLAEVAEGLGYAVRGSVGRRFGGEVWAYPADREDAWFSLETAAEVEGLDIRQLREWAEEGMPHARDGERILVRKTDVRSFGRRPASPARGSS